VLLATLLLPVNTFFFKELIMALKKTITTRQGIEIEDAYFRIVHVTLNGKTGMQFVLAFSKDAQSPSVDSTAYDCAYNLTGENPIAQAYAHLKTLSEFSGAVDC
jgi:hypothetical protein